MNGLARIFTLLINVGLGIVPSGLFFFWIERNCSLPFLPINFGWPWFSPGLESPAAMALWDLALILIFGAIHSLTAQPFFHDRVGKVIPPQAIRTVYLSITGITVTGVMGFWQGTGVVIWLLPMSYLALNLVSMALYFTFLFLAFRIAFRFDALEFIGLKQIYQRTEEIGRTSGTPMLHETGVYAWVRHPIYFFTFLAFVVTPFMTLDRMIVAIGSLLYLAVGIPLEEKKLIVTFGPAYERYRERVPAIFPRFRRKT